MARGKDQGLKALHLGRCDWPYPNDPGTPADRSERAEPKELLDAALLWQGWLRKLWIDGGHSGYEFTEYVKELGPKLDVELVKRSDKRQGF